VVPFGTFSRAETANSTTGEHADWQCAYCASDRSAGYGGENMYRSLSSRHAHRPQGFPVRPKSCHPGLPIRNGLASKSGSNVDDERVLRDEAICRWRIGIGLAKLFGVEHRDGNRAIVRIVPSLRDLCVRACNSYVAIATTETSSTTSSSA
jgi:hypothetical protein